MSNDKKDGDELKTKVAVQHDLGTCPDPDPDSKVDDPKVAAQHGLATCPDADPDSDHRSFKGAQRQSPDPTFPDSVSGR